MECYSELKLEVALGKLGLGGLNWREVALLRGWYYFDSNCTTLPNSTGSSQQQYRVWFTATVFSKIFVSDIAVFVLKETLNSN